MSAWQKIIAGVLSAGLLLGCSGCGQSAPELNTPTTVANIPEVTTTDLSETIPTVTEPDIQETDPIPTLPLPEETQPIPTLPLPEETTPSVTTPIVENNSPAADISANGITSPHLLNLQNLMAAPKYPAQPQRPNPEEYSGYYDLYNAQQQWKAELRDQQVSSPENAHDLDPFMKSAMKQFLSGNGNQVCSPINIYFALAMLAETTGGSSRQQILNLLGHSSIESLRAQANQLWRAHYYNNGETASLLANSVWLDDQYDFYRSTLNTLATDYFASVFTGDLGTADMDRQLAAWLNSQTGGLLSDYTQNIQLDPATVFSLVSTAYFSADWDSTFSTDETTKALFHCDGYDLNTDFMHETYENHAYFVDRNFSAISLSLSGSHEMWLILPDEGYSPEDLLKQGNYYDMICDPYNWSGYGRYTVNLGLPKFDVSSEQDLTSGLKAMGITEVFNIRTANFSPTTNAPVYLGEVSHAARVAVDEEGVIAAAYTILQAPGAALPPETEEVDFILDRPFLFIITGSDNLPLFSGVVNKP